MVDVRNARIRAYTSNISRDERLLKTRLSDVERRSSKDALRRSDLRSRH